MKLKFNKTYFTIATLLFIIEVCIALFLKTGFIRHSFGDYLVVILLYCVIKGFINFSVFKTSVLVLIIAFSVEFLQLTTILQYFNLENNTLAKIIFGTTFQITDLVAYTLGIITILYIEKQNNENNQNTIAK